MNLRRALITLLTIICITVNIAGIFLYQRHKHVQSSAQWVTHSYEVIDQSQAFYSNIEKIVALQRGFLLSHEPAFLEDYRETSQQLDAGIDKLLNLTQDNADNNIKLRSIQQNLGVLRVMLDLKINQVKIRTSKKTSVVLVDDSLYQVKTITDQLRQEMAKFLEDEQRLLHGRISDNERQELYYFYSLFFASAVSILVLIIANTLILRLSLKNREVTSELDIVEQDLDNAQERLKLVLQGTSDGVFDWNMTSGDIYFSHRYRDMLGYNLDEFPNTVDAFDAILHPDDKERFWQHFNDYMNDEIPEYRDEFRLQHKDNSWHWYLARAKALNDDTTHKRYRFVGAHTDISEIKATEERLKASNRELEDFTYIASHDLRSPLVNLKGFAGEIESSLGLLKEFIPEALTKVKTEKAAEILEVVQTDLPQALSFINVSVTRMEKLTRAILELSRVGRRQLRFEILDTNAIVDNCLKTFHHQIETSKVEIVRDTLPDIIGDMIAIEQVIANLIDNALKYMDPKRPGRIEITGKRGPSETTINIADNGRGIRGEDLKKIFELFKRAGKHSNIPGEGMGLSYVQTILRRHDGTIWVDSELDHGSVFHFSIPNFLTPESLSKEESNV